MSKPDYRQCENVGQYKDLLEAAHPPRRLSIFICWKCEEFQRAHGLTFPEAWQAMTTSKAIIVIPPKRHRKKRAA